ncbi:MAG: hypothetical protein FJW49_02925 [Actinobacteria bacterium]|nr:hypothetical protein [Actinomycetota bacterium]
MLGGINNQLFFQSLAGFFVMFVLILLLKWAFARGNSVVEKPTRIGDEGEYGLLRVVAKPGSHIEGEMLRQKLESNGIKATLTQTKRGPRIMVFPEEVKAAEAILRS